MGLNLPLQRYFAFNFYYVTIFKFTPVYSIQKENRFSRKIIKLYFTYLYFRMQLKKYEILLELLYFSVRK